MNQFKIAFIILLIGVFSSGCYTIVYNSVEGDVLNDEVTYYPPPVYYPHPAPPPVYYPPPPCPFPAPVEPPPPEYKTRQPENNGSDRKRDDGVVGPIRNKGGRGNNGSRR
ncbi:MAG: hypothetical protein V3V72_05765 [Ignavibacteriaceae bacterium]|jgi:hypothetical protein